MAWRATAALSCPDMSNVTHFQIYMALRLACYEVFANAPAAVPFVANNIMETFDERVRRRCFVRLERWPEEDR